MTKAVDERNPRSFTEFRRHFSPHRSWDGVWLIFRPKCVALRENDAAENVPDPLILREISVHPVNDYLCATIQIQLLRNWRGRRRHALHDGQ